jgi:hypothetical protein
MFELQLGTQPTPIPRLQLKVMFCQVVHRVQLRADCQMVLVHQAVDMENGNMFQAFDLSDYVSLAL